MFNLLYNRRKKFQKNLIVWKRGFLMTGIPEPFFVSEELNSVETGLSVSNCIYIVVVFQKNLIVWKLFTS